MSSQEQNNTNTSSSSTPNQSESELSEGAAPLWNYVTKLDEQGLTGGTWKFKCSFCNLTRQGSYSRVKGHLLGIAKCGIAACTKVTRSQKHEMEKLEEEFWKKKSESGAREVPLACETETSAKRKRSAFSPIEAAFGAEARDQLDQEIARMFYTGGLPFNLARNPHYHRSYQFAAAQKIDGYVPPGYNKLRTTLMEKEKANVEKHLMILKSTWKERGVSVVSDGWSDPTRKPLINFIATSANAPLFLKAVNCFGEVKDKFFIADLMKEVINQVGHQDVVQVITENAANCKAAGEIIEGLFPHIYWTSCVVHTLNLALKNICAAKNTETNLETYTECKWITKVHEEALAIKNFIMNLNMRLAIFRKFSTLKLLSVAD